MIFDFREFEWYNESVKYEHKDKVDYHWSYLTMPANRSCNTNTP